MADFLENVAVVLGTMAAVAAVLGIVVGGAHWVGNSRAWRWAEARLIFVLVPLRNWAASALFTGLWIASIVFLWKWAFDTLGTILGILFLIFIAPGIAGAVALLGVMAAPIAIVVALLLWIIWLRGA